MHASPSPPRWRKSSHSGGNNNCVEVARFGGDVGVRDSKNPAVRPLTLSPPTWRTILAQVKAGVFDL